MTNYEKNTTETKDCLIDSTFVFSIVCSLVIKGSIIDSTSVFSIVCPLCILTNGYFMVLYPPASGPPVGSILTVS